jgi:hypothetical protein
MDLLKGFANNKTPLEEWNQTLAKIKYYNNFSKGEVIRKVNEDDKLHCDTGPAYISPTRLTWFQNGRKHGLDIDIYGTTNYYYENILIPEDYFLHPEDIDIDEVFKSNNQEIKYVGMKMIGFDRLKESKRVKVIHTDEENERELFQVDGIFEEPIVIVRVLNSTPEPDGSRKPYYLTVKPTIKTCQEAVAWTFGLEPDEYHPIKET